MVEEEPDSLTLRYLRRMSADLAQLKGDMSEVKERLGLLEAQGASLSRRLDRMGGDLEQVRRRLDLVDTPTE